MSWAGHMACMRDKWEGIGEKSGKKETTRKTKAKVDNIKLYLREIELDDMD
jgi:hypothetical protein